MAQTQNSDADAYSIDEFCERHRISRAKYYLLRGESRTPREMKIGSRVLISVEAAADWRRRMETETQTSAA